MATFRVPFPREPERRQALFDRAASTLASHGKWEGNQEEGRFEGKSPLGPFAGSYRVVEGADEIEFTIHKKPLLIPMSMIEREARKFATQA